MNGFAAVLRSLVAGENLDEARSYALFGEIMDATISPVQAAGLLAALAAKHESVQEITGAARAMRDRGIHVEHDVSTVVDVVGTGGDGADTINISTMAALVVAACGVPVAKHGNRAASSACGSADVLEAAGMAIDVEPARAARMLRETGFTFMFAPRYHPAMRNVAPVRRELGIRTIFNVLGPLTNPARATHQVVGVARESLLEPLGEVLRELGVHAGAVVYGADGLDEIGGDAPTLVYRFGPEGVRRERIEPGDYGIHATLAQLRGGSVERCVEAFTAILRGERSPRAGVVALNAGFVLWACGFAGTLREGIENARAILHTGKAFDLFVRGSEMSVG